MTFLEHAIVPEVRNCDQRDKSYFSGPLFDIIHILLVWKSCSILCPHVALLYHRKLDSFSEARSFKKPSKLYLNDNRFKAERDFYIFVSKKDHGLQ